MDILNLINEAIANAILKLGKDIGLEISADVTCTPIYIVLENDGEAVEEFYDVYEAISFINQMEL